MKDGTVARPATGAATAFDSAMPFRSPAAAPVRVPGDRLPQPPRQRKPALAALAVLLIIGGAFGSALLVLRSGDRIPVIAIARAVPSGRQFTAEDFVEVQVAKTDVETVAWSQRFQVLPFYASVGLVPGTLLNSKMTAREGNFTPNTVVVGISLKSGQAPPVGLTQGAHVRVYTVDDSVPADQRELASSAIVYGVAGDSKELGSSSETRLSLIVDAARGAAIASAASAGEVAIALLPETATSG